MEGCVVSRGGEGWRGGCGVEGFPELDLPVGLLHVIAFSAIGVLR